MSKNLLNSIAVLFILTVLTACVCGSGRDSLQGEKKTDAPADVNNESKDVANGQKDGSRSEKEDRGDFVVEYEGVSDPRYADVDRQFKKDKTLEKAAAKLNSALSLPTNIYLRTKDCGERNAFFDPNDSSVTVCYELMEHFYTLFRANGDDADRASEKMTDTVQFVFLHEIGHALIHVYDLPVTANEEDAADRCSSYINLEELGEPGVNAVLSAAEAFRIESEGKVPTQRSLADEHLLQEQRFYNSLCMLYGSNPQKYSDILDKGYLPEARAVRCPSEYDRTVSSWVKLLEPWRKQ